MNKWLKVASSLTAAAVLALPASVSASPNVNAKALLDANVKVTGTTIEVNAGLNAKGLVDSGNLLNSGEFRIVDQNGKVLYAKKGANLKLHAKIENLKPNVEYCLDVQVKGKVLDKLVNANVRAHADQKIKLLSEQGLIKIKNGYLCVKTGDPGDKTPKQPTPKQPDTPKQPVSPKQPDTPKKPDTPKQDQPAKDQPKVEKPSLLDRLLSIF